MGTLVQTPRPVMGQPAPSDRDLLARAAERRRADALQFYAEGRSGDAARAMLDARILEAHATVAMFDHIPGRRPPGNRAAMLRFARAVLAD